jgi:predicted nucleotidyltransferase
MTTDIEAILQALVQHDVEFILIGGAAAIALGTARLTFDVDVVYRRTEDNVERLIKALKDHQPYMRGAPPGLPFEWRKETILSGLNFTLTTDLGGIDVLGEVAGGGKYEELSSHAIEVEAFGVKCLCVDLETLIRLKRAAGRPKDLEAIAELEALLEEREKME